VDRVQPELGFNKGWQEFEPLFFLIKISRLRHVVFRLKNFANITILSPCGYIAVF
jgi:hypothetical protein